MKNLRLEIEYIGTNYSGWQKQTGRPTVQQIIEDAVFAITSQRPVIYGSGRTDSGVHALAQVANFKTGSHLTTRQMQRALNSVLPDDITVSKVKQVPLKFHSQYDSKSKVYVYTILNRDYPSAHMKYRTWLVKEELDLDKMRKASSHLVGTHDFKVFSHSGLSVKTTVRTILNTKLRKKGSLVEFEIEGIGFLKRMVRLIMGTLVHVGKGHITPSAFKQILYNGEKTKYVISAPAKGLTLKKVKY